MASASSVIPMCLLLVLTCTSERMGNRDDVDHDQIKENVCRLK
jgi:hypothetical protein